MYVPNPLDDTLKAPTLDVIGVVDWLQVNPRSKLKALDPIVALTKETSGGQRTGETKESSLVANARKIAEARKS